MLHDSARPTVQRRLCCWYVRHSHGAVVWCGRKTVLGIADLIGSCRSMSVLPLRVGCDPRMIVRLLWCFCVCCVFAKTVFRRREPNGQQTTMATQELYTVMGSQWLSGGLTAATIAVPTRACMWTGLFVKYARAYLSVSRIVPHGSMSSIGAVRYY